MALYAPDPDISAADLIDDLGRVLAERYANAEDELIREVARHAYRDLGLQEKLARAEDDRKPGLQYALRRNRELAELAARRAQALRELQAKALQVAGRIRDEGLAEELIDVAAQQGEAEAAARLSMARRLPATTTLNGTATQAVAQVALSLQSRLEALNQRITRYPQDAYQRIVSMTSPNVLLGTQTKLLAQRLAVQRFLAQGITGFVDKADRNWRIGTYAEMAGRTSVARAFNDAGIWRMQQSGVNLVTVQGGLASCPRCAPWVGKILSTDGTTGQVTLPHATRDEPVTVDIVATLDAARNAGLFHPNCSHKVTAYLPGLPIPQAGFEYSEEADKARERQRDLEVQIRAAKRQEATAGDAVSAQRAKAKVRQKQQELRDHLQATGRKRNSAREQLHFADGHGGTGKASGRGTPSMPSKPKGPRPGPDILISQSSKLGQDVRAARSSIAKVHTIPNTMPNLPVQGANLRPGENGLYRGSVGVLLMSPTARTPQLTFAHEIGHFLDHKLLGNNTLDFESMKLTDPETRKWAAAVGRSASVAELKRLFATQDPDLHKHVTYLLGRRELWGRSYAQYIAIRSGNERMLAELDDIRSSTDAWTRHRQWGTTDFEPIASAIDEIFKAKGLLK